MDEALALIDRLGDTPRMKLEAEAVKVDGMVALLHDVALLRVCKWLLENHPGVCMAMPRVSEHLLKMVPLTTYNEWFQAETLARVTRGVLLASSGLEGRA